ncbi:DUF1003 domain-containing protein [Nitrospirillum sp. BR 11163]|uniref:DUF1003 domain-containing protein n=1 Tax=Nitrospirillum sp. BR 11163 TaxID=3104323 RepID=UPI002B00113F|nr:DUF1003 domain-containing protein [Nitrospirillum sp. BR 11163]MEA1677178.1 DUF1003 domain-containing protein [Nitrospirillum sp. BR 11163]
MDEGRGGMNPQDEDVAQPARDEAQDAAIAAELAAEAEELADIDLGDEGDDDGAEEEPGLDGAPPSDGTAPAGGKRVACGVTGKLRPKRDLISLDTLRPSLAVRIRRDHPGLPPDALVSRGVVARYRSLYVEELLQQEKGELTELDRQVAESIATHETLAENIEEGYAEERTLGERMSDHLASFGGSWTFILTFAGFLIIWMAFSGFQGAKSFDPYPFILLNLILSCLAAIQAPIIMMSQKRQEAKDRLRSENDYRVNLKAELEIRHLHEKIDYLIQRQWKRLTEIQQLQLEIMQEKRYRR